MINPVTLEKTDTTEVSVILDEEAISRITAIQQHKGYTLNQIVDYALIDYYLDVVGRLFAMQEDADLQLSPERMQNREHILEYLVFDTWDDVLRIFNESTEKCEFYSYCGWTIEEAEGTEMEDVAEKLIAELRA